MTLGIHPMLGRLISADEDVKGGPRNVGGELFVLAGFSGQRPSCAGQSDPAERQQLYSNRRDAQRFHSTEGTRSCLRFLVGRISRCGGRARRTFHAHLLAAETGRAACTGASRDRRGGPPACRGGFRHREGAGHLADTAITSFWWGMFAPRCWFCSERLGWYC